MQYIFNNKTDICY